MVFLTRIQASPGSLRAMSWPLIMAHRGASGYRPEHTLAAYELAVEMGADCIEPDLVMTSDGVLVDRHEPEIGGTTDVSCRAEFADRRATKVLDGSPIDGWWVEDFTLGELKSLRAIERLPKIRPDNTAYDRLWDVPTLTEVLDLRESLSAQHGREIGIVPEIKHPTYLRALGFDPEAAMMTALEKAGMNTAAAPLWVQSFEWSSLVALRERFGCAGRLVFLNEDGKSPYDLVAAGDSRTYADLLTPRGLDWLAESVDAIGPEKVLVIPRREDGTLGDPTALVTDAHAVGLHVIPWTFRVENRFLPSDYRLAAADGSIDPAGPGRAAAEFEAYLEAGIDAAFCDHTDVYVQARTQFVDRKTKDPERQR
jgi:glycerophosphoryl diester phosphodiesterase